MSPDIVGGLGSEEFDDWPMEGQSTGQENAAAYNPTLRSVPQNALGHLLVAKQLYKQGKFALVIKEVDKVLALNPELSTGYMMRGIAAMKLGLIDEARESLTVATRIQGDLLYGWMVLGQIERDAGNLKQALHAATQATNADPHHGPAYLLQGSILAMLERRDDALLAYREAVRRDPNSTIARNKYASALIEAGREEEAEQQIVMAHRLNPSVGRSRIALGDLYLARKDYPRAIEEYNAATEINPAKSALPLGKLGEAYYLSGQIDEAIRSLKLALKRDPKQVDSYLLLGRIFQEQGQLNEAADQFRVAISVDSNYPASRELLEKCEKLLSDANGDTPQPLTE